MNGLVNKASRLLPVAALVSAMLLIAATTAGAQTNVTMHFHGVNYEVTSNFFPVGNPAEGHFTGISLRRGLTTFETGEVGAAESVEYIDILKGVGTSTGYATITFGDGSSFTTKIDNHFSISPKGLAAASIKTAYVKGTGRFEGIKGTEVITANQINSTKDFAGFTQLDGTAIYTLPSK